jgi:anaerobic ribonucleoside-triphosphate reductase
VDPDKISKILEKQLKALGQQIRIDILKKLDNNEHPLSYSTLQKEVLGTNPSSVNFTFHLKALKEIDFINSSAEGYFITTLGKRMLKTIFSMEQILNDEKKTIMIRTSKYSKEPFNIKKIEEYLIKEGNVEKFLANKIALEVQTRLSKANIEYLTAPLVREYVNAVLLENGLEEIRHKLTRLGTPPFEVSKLFKSNSINPDIFLQKLGSDVSEQYLLLNLLPKKHADLYLSGDIALLNLNYWSLRPLGIYLNCESILDLLFKKYMNKCTRVESSRDCINLIINFTDVLMQFKHFFSEDIILGEFNNEFLSHFNYFNEKDILHLFNLLKTQIRRFNDTFGDHKSHISLEFCNNKNVDFKNLYSIFLKKMSNGTNNHSNFINPNILYDYSNISSSKNPKDQIKSIISLLPISKTIFYNKSPLNLVNNTIVKINGSRKNANTINRVILDKMLINLHQIALQSNQNDAIFYDILQDRIKSTIELFNYKEKLVKKKLDLVKNWKFLTSTFLNYEDGDWLDNAVRSVSFFGLNEAIKVHCGIELDKVEKSSTFALNILRILKNVIKEQKELDNNYYSLSQPHNDIYLTNRYSSQIIRDESHLSFENKLTLFQKFAAVIDGGNYFNAQLNHKDENFYNDIKLIMDSKIQTFSI